jgi:hypothetical protein
MGYDWEWLKKKPTTRDLQIFIKLVALVDFMKADYRPFSLIGYQAIKKRIINKEEKNALFVTFKRITNTSLRNMFEVRYSPEDQSFSGKERYEYQLKEGITKEIFENKIKEYAKKNFKVKVF